VVQLKRILMTIIFLLLLCSQGLAFSTLSIDSAGFVSNDPNLNGDAWLLTVVMDGNAQEAVGTIEANDMTGEGGSHALHDLTIKTQFLENSCEYDINRNYDPSVYKYTIYSKKGLWAWSADAYRSECESKSNFWRVIPASSNLITYDVYCITRDQVGVPATIKTPIESFEAELVVSSQGDTYTAIIENKGETSVKAGRVMYAKWHGGLSSGESCPNIASEGYIGMNGPDGNWRLTKNIYYNSYRNYDQSYVQPALDHILDVLYADDVPSKESAETVVTRLQSLNKKADDALSSFGDQTSSGAEATVEGSLYSGKISIDLDRALTFPVISMYVKTSWLGIYIPVGKPKIISLSSNEFEEGSTGYITAQIKNVGTATGAFEVAVDCPNPFSLSTTTRKITLDSGADGKVTIPFTGTTNEVSEAKCSVKAYDVNNPSIYDQSSVTVKVTCMNICVPGSTRCEGKERMKCTGCAWELIPGDTSCDIDCHEDSDCNDEDLCTKDSCVFNKCVYTLRDFPGCEGEMDDRRRECEAKGGNYIPAKDAPWYKPWRSDQPDKCRIPHFSILGIGLIILGVILLIWLVEPLMIILIVLGAIIQLLATLGLI